jgi:hypothetical protein
VDERRFGHGKAILDRPQDRMAGPLRRAPSGPSGTIYEDVFALVIVLFLLVALAAASFFQHMLAAFIVLLSIPVLVLLHAVVGTFYALFTLAAFAIFVALIQTITSSLALLREANTRPHRLPRPAEPQRATRRSSRSRIAA